MEMSRLPKIKVNNIQSDFSEFEDLEAPITGHEILSACKRHTVYKIYVHCNGKQGWFIHRRYSEFYKLRTDLKKVFPAKEFTLPPKRYFGDNFEPKFLNGRRQGLQGFLYMITRQRDVLKSPPVAEFLALNNPPSQLEDVRQCKAIIDQLEAELVKLRLAKNEHSTTVSTSNGQIAELNNQKQAVLAALRFERQQHGKKHYPGDDLSLMFEYRSLSEVSRVDVSSFLVRKAVAGFARKLDEKARKTDEKPRKEDVRVTRDEVHATNRSGRSHTPSASEYGRYDQRYKHQVRKSQPYIEIQSPKSKGRDQFASSDSVASPSNEFRSFYEIKERRKSMPGAVEFHKVNHILKNRNHAKTQEHSTRPTSLAVPGIEGRPRSFSANPSHQEEILEAGLKHSAVNRVKRQISLESPKRNAAWSSLKDLRKLKNKV